MVYPAEWQDNMGNTGGEFNKNILAHKVHDTEKGLMIKNKVSPPITIPQLKQMKNRTITKDFSDKIDNDFRTRPSQLSDYYFKEMPKLIKVKTKDLSMHYLPGFTKTEDNLYDMPRKFDKVHKHNEFGFERTATKSMTNGKVNPQDVTPEANQKNKFNVVPFDAARESGGNTPIVAVPHRRKLITIKT
tara:strand:+ start:297 stop:860 length:564 start_codon:yes stop_codon:yes gene_type:complete